LYLSAIDELEQLLPNGTLYFVEGGGQQQQDPNTHPDWGDGFVTNAGIISRNGWSGGLQLDLLHELFVGFSLVYGQLHNHCQQHARAGLTANNQHCGASCSQTLLLRVLQER